MQAVWFHSSCCILDSGAHRSKSRGELSPSKWKECTRLIQIAKDRVRGGDGDGICQLSALSNRRRDKSCAGRHANYEWLSRHSTQQEQIQGNGGCGRGGGIQNQPVLPAPLKPHFRVTSVKCSERRLQPSCVSVCDSSLSTTH